MIDSQIQPVTDANYALIDTGNPIMNIANDVLAQMTNAWAANPEVSPPLLPLPVEGARYEESSFCRYSFQNYVLPCDSPFDLVFQFG